MKNNMSKHVLAVLISGMSLPLAAHAADEEL